MSLPSGASLGSTKDPTELIRGSVTAVGEQIMALEETARTAAKLAAEFEHVEIPDWTGITQMAYSLTRVGLIRKWDLYIERLKRSALALDSYETSLRSAQNSAADAVAKWDAAEAATKLAEANHQNDVDAYNRQVTAHNSAIHSGQVVPPIALTRPGPFKDPGQPLRDEAQQILDDARSTLDSAGFAAISQAAFDEQESFLGTSLPDAISKLKDGDPKALIAVMDKLRSAFREAGAPGDIFGAEGTLEGFKVDNDSIQLIGANGEVYVYKLEEKWTEDVGELKISGDGTYTLYSADGEIAAKLTKEGLTLEANAHINLINGKREFSAEHGYMKGDLSAYGSAGAETENSLTLNNKGGHVGSEAFAGGKIGGGGKVGAGGLGAGADVEGWAGAGYAADLDVGWEDGRVNIKAAAGLAVGLGAKVTPEVVLDFPEMYDTGKDMIAHPDQIADNFSMTPDEWITTARDTDGARKVIDHMTFDPGEARKTGESVAKVIGGLL
ncbi:putative T7SS-secreted protein [Nocardioides sp. NPDC047086]|uniref:putative T7SS-secreted protein n=1 Tax=Nocardioides sp. NPDC047086 TaxID=3154810 RepID=UPI0033EE3812